MGAKRNKTPHPVLTTIPVLPYKELFDATSLDITLRIYKPEKQQDIVNTPLTQADRDQILMGVPNGGDVYLKNDCHIKGAFCAQGTQLKVEGRSAGGLYVYYQWTLSDQCLHDTHAHLSFDVLTCRAIQVAEQMVK